MSVEELPKDIIPDEHFYPIINLYVTI